MMIWHFDRGFGRRCGRHLDRRSGLPGLLAAALAAAVAIALLVPAPAIAQEGWPREIDHLGGRLTLQGPPQRIVSTSPSLTGTLLAIDAPVVATAAAMRGPLTDAHGFFRQWADVAQERGVAVLYPELAFDIEAVILQEPDLIVVSATGGDSVLAHVPELEALGYPVLVLDYGIHPWQQLATDLGRATGHEAQASAVTQAFRDHAAEVGAGISAPPGPVSVISYNFFNTYGVSKPTSAQARVLADMGLEVVGLPDSLAGAVTRSVEFDFVSHENLSSAITGQSLFLLAAEEGDVQAVLDDPVLANLPAVQAGRVYPLGKTSFRIDYFSGRAIIDGLAARFAE